MTTVLDLKPSAKVKLPRGNESWPMTSKTSTILAQMANLNAAKSALAHEQYTVAVIGGSVSREAAAFDSSATAKRYTASVAMHLDRSWREKLSRQLDILHDVEEWSETDKPMAIESFETFIRVVLQLRPSRNPSLGMTSGGNVVAAWLVEQDRLILECLPHRFVQITLARDNNGSIERATMHTTVDRLAAVLAPYNVERWFTSAIRQPPS